MTWSIKTTEALRETAASLPARVTALSGDLRVAYDTRPVNKAEWDAATGDDVGTTEFPVTRRPNL